MNSASHLSLRVLAFGLTLVLAPAVNAASQAARTSQHVTERLAADGSLPIDAAGPYVQVGTFRIQVSSKLGRPDRTLRDGTWLYENYAIPNSDARGTLVVRFEKGRVRELAIALPAVVAALRQHEHASTAVVASQP